MSRLSQHNPNVSQKAEFSVRIVVCDSYQCKPTPGVDVIYSEFRGSDIKQVPILRIFGAAPDGHKVCLHVHGVFPFFYIPCPTSNPEPQFLYRIAASLDKALNIALKQATSSNQHVYKILLVKGLPLYGFHDREHLFLKIFLYNPGLIKQAVELCSNGAILGQVFQPHEAHINFTLQFFIDFNLFGMSNIDLQSVTFRKNGTSQSSNDPLKSPDVGLKPESTCHYEVDCLASHIINRQRVGKGDGFENPGLEEVWNQEIERRKQLNVSMSKTLSQESVKINYKETDSHNKYQQMFLCKLSNLLDKPAKEKVTNDEGNVNYPAESLEGSQVLNAMDVSMHLPDSTSVNSWSESMRKNFDDTLVDHDDTLVDETIALNSSLSLHYSQVQMDKDDLELVDMLHDMEEETVEDDSILMSSAHENKQDGVAAYDIDDDDDDDKYSQIFNEETLLLEPCKGDGTAGLSWDDSFWDSANIPQLDGTCEDDYVKKVRKRKMRSFKLGLSKPKKSTVDVKQNPASNLDVSELDEINASQETIGDLSGLYLKKSVKLDPESKLEVTYSNAETKPSITDLVYHDHVELRQSNAKLYDKQRNFEAVAGPSKLIAETSKSINKEHEYLMDTSQSSPEDVGIKSFYNMSKIFDVSVDDNPTKKFGLCEAKVENSELNRHETERCVLLTPMIRPPTKSDVLGTLEKYEIPEVRNPEPYYSDPKDVGDKVEIGQMTLKLHSKCAQHQKPYGKVLEATSIEEWRQLLFLENNELSDNPSNPDTLKILLAGNKQCVLEPLLKPPTRKEVLKWLEVTAPEEKNQVVLEEICKYIDDVENSQAIGLNEEINNSVSLECNETETKNTLQVTMQEDGSYLCFGNNQNSTENSSDPPTAAVDFLTLMLIEVHASTRGDLHPNPKYDPILAVFIVISNDCPPNHLTLLKSHTEIIVADPSQSPKYLDRCILKADVRYVNSEIEIIEKVIELVREHDPDIMCGYEIEMSSWGYVLERAQILGLEVVKDISRITEKHRQKKWRGDDNNFEGKIIGRITFNVWRLFRHELALSSYSFENCMYEILKERVPKFSYAELTKWWNDESRMLRWLPVEYYLTRLSGTVRMLEKLDIIKRTSELARVFGLQWWEVWARGSQRRVESLLLRAARPLNLLALSPAARQRAAMRAPHALPLIFEPESRFYSDPVIVLDFQSLYPSIMIAYNYCFSTCIGRIQNINCDSEYEFGAWRLRVPRAQLEQLARGGLLQWSPAGAGFVRRGARRGVLPALLRRVLAARLAVKHGMRLHADAARRKALHSKQLALKLIANVTYGYTAANFSGRMPCVEVADSVVSQGRHTLQRAVDLVHAHRPWRAQVVYGDTDSLFVWLPGRSRAAAFLVGAEIAAAVSADNPHPVTLKLEKVYQPCILQTKKRYAGYMYEGPEQQHAVFEAKGIETVRRDGCPAGVKLLQQLLCELFSSGDMSRVKRRVREGLERVCAGAGLGAGAAVGGGPAELLMTREYRGAAAYRAGATAPPNEIAKRISRSDERACPRVGERVAWLVAAGAPGAPLAALARSPRELLRCDRAPLLPYYVARVLLPPLHRCLSLLGVDVFKWWAELGQSRECGVARPAAGGIARYLRRERCAACGARAARGGGPAGGGPAGGGPAGGGPGGAALCRPCARAPRPAALRLTARARAAHAHLLHCDMICKSCCGHRQFDMCENTECPVLWRRLTAQRNLTQWKDVITDLPPQFACENLDF